MVKVLLTCFNILYQYSSETELIGAINDLDFWVVFISLIMIFVLYLICLVITSIMNAGLWKQSVKDMWAQLKMSLKGIKQKDDVRFYFYFFE